MTPVKGSFEPPRRSQNIQIENYWVSGRFLGHIGHRECVSEGVYDPDLSSSSFFSQSGHQNINKLPLPQADMQSCNRFQTVMG